jgi:hypothetical protein
MLKSNMSNLASINEWDVFTLFQVLKKINFGNIKKKLNYGVVLDIAFLAKISVCVKTE